MLLQAAQLPNPCVTSSPVLFQVLVPASGHRSLSWDADFAVAVVAVVSEVGAAAVGRYVGGGLGPNCLFTALWTQQFLGVIRFIITM